MSDNSGHYRRDVGTFGVVFLIVNSIIGSGIFGLPEMMHEAVGTFAPWLVLAGSLVIANVAICFAALTSLTDRSGGPQRYATDAFGRFPGFEVGWIFYFARVLTQAANVTVLVTYAAPFVPALGEGAGRALAIVAVIGAITTVNILGIKRAVEFLGGVTALKLIPLIVLAVVAVIGAAAPGPLVLPKLSAVEGIALAALYAFVGFENATTPAGETHDPKRAMPRAMMISLPVITAIYFAIQYGYSHSPVAGTGPEAPLSALAAHYGGNIGAILMGLTVLVSVFGNVTAGHTTSSRITAAMADDRLLPAWFGRISRWATPHNSVVFFGLCAMGFALSGTFAKLAVAATLCRMLVFIVSISALPLLRHRHGLPALSGLLLFAAPVAMLFCVWAAFQSSAEQWLLLSGFVAIGTVLFALASRSERPSA